VPASIASARKRSSIATRLFRAAKMGGSIEQTVILFGHRLSEFSLGLHLEQHIENIEQRPASAMPVLCSFFALFALNHGSVTADSAEYDSAHASGRRPGNGRAQHTNP